MKAKITLIAVLFILCGWIMAFAETTIKAEVDKLSITQDEDITYKLIITSSAKIISEPRLPDFAGFTVLSQAESSTVSLVKSGVKSVLVYAYVLAPVEPGKIKIKPSRVKADNKVISSQEFEIEVKPARPGKKNLLREKPAPSPEVPSESRQPQVVL